MRITRLGEDVDATRRLAPAAIDRTVTTLREFRRVMDDLGVQRTRMTATSAARDATNREAFLAAAASAIGVRPELLPGEEEGRLSFVGATTGLDPGTAPWLVADIGGGSTELIVGHPHKAPEAVRSLDIGCVRITERFLPDDPPTPSQVDDARCYVGGLLAETDPVFTTARTLVGLAGTVSALARLDQELGTYERGKVHHYLLSRETVERLLDTLAGEPAAARRRRPGMEAERADVIVGGTAVLAELMRHFDFGACLHSESDILDGVVSTLLAR
jgi:exopolyphosphatase/guanosine-5'-triphosphate,3'-diphosphate pyrophosphatase